MCHFVTVAVLEKNNGPAKVRINAEFVMGEDYLQNKRKISGKTIKCILVISACIIPVPSSCSHNFTTQYNNIYLAKKVNLHLHVSAYFI